jgi:hypothetical protein
MPGASAGSPGGALQRRALRPGAPGVALLLPGRPAFLSASGAGQSLPPAVQAKMEGIFRTSFAGVRIHVRPELAALGAVALTQGNNLYFAPGHYAPAVPAGEHLLARQLAHVVQQKSGRAANPFGGGIVVVNDPLLEAEAERMACRATATPAARTIPVARTAPAAPAAWTIPTGAATRLLPPPLPSRPEPRGAVQLMRRGRESDDENPYQKQYAKKGAASPRLGRVAKEKHTLVNTNPRLSKREKKIVGIVGGSEKPGYNPVKDKQGHKVWDGQRKGLTWYDNVKAAMAASQAGGCTVNRGGCTGAADGIDHVKDFADEQTGLTRYVVCDGMHHFSACYREETLDLYNGGNTKTTPVGSVDTSNLQWACTICNSGKNGTKGVYTNIPNWSGVCPAREGDCGYNFRGEAATD